MSVEKGLLHPHVIPQSCLARMPFSEESSQSLAEAEHRLATQEGAALHNTEEAVGEVAETPAAAEAEVSALEATSTIEQAAAPQ